MKPIIILLPILLTLQVQSNIFFLNLALKSTSYYNCYLSNGHPMIVLNLAESNTTDAIAPDNIQNVYNAKNAGLKVEGIVYPCRGRTVEQNVQIVANAFPYPVFQRIWVSFPDNSTVCGWQHYQASSNCQYLQSLMQKFSQTFQIPTQIFTSKTSWTDTFKYQLGCPQVGQSKLWWINQLPDQPNFNTYTKIGGWARPYAKIYNMTNICGSILFQNYWES